MEFRRRLLADQESRESFRKEDVRVTLDENR
jgi:hypothetical protein